MVGSLRYEWRRITSIRSTWILLASSIVVAILFALLFVFVLDQSTTDPSIMEGGPPLESISLSSVMSQSAANFIGLIILGTLAAQAFGQEYRHGTIRLTLTAFPRRANVFVSKVLVCCFFITVGFLMSLAFAALILTRRSDLFASDLSAAGMSEFFARQWLYLMGFVLIVFAITVLTRILALGVIIPLVMAVVLEPLVGALIAGPLPWLAKILPFAAGLNFANGDDLTRNGFVFLGWVAVLIAAGFAVFKVRDA